MLPSLALRAVALHALAASAQTAKDVKGATPLVAIQNEAPPKLIVDPPIPEVDANHHPLDEGKVTFVIPEKVEHHGRVPQCGLMACDAHGGIDF